jgi:hypothetical protein
MKLGDIARVARGVVTGNAKLFIMTREEAKERHLDAFVRPILGGARDLPSGADHVVRDGPDRRVILLASSRDLEEYPILQAYLAGTKPRLTRAAGAPIAATYVGQPRFYANPDGLIVTNALYTVTPRQKLDDKEIRALVDQLNAATENLPKSRFVDRYSPRTLEALEI